MSSLEGVLGLRFLTRSRVFDDAELAALDAAAGASVGEAGSRG
jgi:hypothetical protein